jgi:hypothetical protein
MLNLLPFCFLDTNAPKKHYRFDPRLEDIFPKAGADANPDT